MAPESKMPVNADLDCATSYWFTPCVQLWPLCDVMTWIEFGATHVCHPCVVKQPLLTGGGPVLAVGPRRRSSVV